MSRDRGLWIVSAITIVLGLAGCSPSGVQSGATALPSQTIELPSPTVAPQSVETPDPTAAPRPLGARQMVENTLSLREYWRVSHTCLGGSPYIDLPLIAVAGRVACLHYDRASNTSDLWVYDAPSGVLLWQAPGKPGEVALAADSERIYFVVHHFHEIRAYDLDDGEPLWEMQIFPYKVLGLQSDGEKLYIRELMDDMLSTLDARTGEILSRESLVIDDDGFVWSTRFPEFDLYYSFLYGQRDDLKLKAVDAATQQTRWLAQDTGLWSFHRPPVLVDDVLLVNVQGEVVAFDAQSGQVVWRNLDPSHSGPPMFATLAVMMDGSLYALRYDARLLRLDPKTGQEIGSIQFTPGLPDISHGISDFFNLAADGGMLFLSFDDTEELIALGP